MVSREFYISGLRQLALEQKIVLAASTSAKIKTATQITLVIYLLLSFPFANFFFYQPVAYLLIIISAIISIYSAVEYTIKNRAIF
jgi:CDP-diacylglycerol--glycerol-3-phosphate 3-phosphatidyltransferase